MNSYNKLPAGVRLDLWPNSFPAQPPDDGPEVTQLREELRKSMPQLAEMLEILKKLRPIQELAARLAGPPQAEVITKRG